MRNRRKSVGGRARPYRPVGRLASCAAGLFLSLLLLFASALAFPSRGKEKLSYGQGLIVNIPLPVSEVQLVVEDVAANGIIRGTKEYNKDEFVGGAKAASFCHVFPAWTEAGKVFYKVREQAIDPRNFKDSGDVGTLAVRYVVQPQGNKNTVLRIDALFEEDFRHTVHQSSGSVESSEYKDIQEHLEAIEVMKKQTIESETERQEQLAKKRKAPTPTYAPTEIAQESSTRAVPPPAETQPESGSQPSSKPAAAQSQAKVLSSPAAPTPTPSNPDPPSQSPSGQSLPGQSLPGQSLEDRVKNLRQQVERLVKAPGAPLKSAPFHTASTLQTLNSGTEVLILISTPYWYGVETHEGQHGWIMRDQLEQP
jgi:hypothetical protein